MNDDNPFDILFDPNNDLPESMIVKHGAKVDADEFVQTLETLAAASREMSTLQYYIETLDNTGLEREDVVNLIWARTRLNKGDIRNILDTFDHVESQLGNKATRRELFIRLVPDISNIGISDTKTIFEELEALNDRYGEGNNE